MFLTQVFISCSDELHSSAPSVPSAPSMHGSVKCSVKTCRLPPDTGEDCINDYHCRSCQVCTGVTSGTAPSTPHILLSQFLTLLPPSPCSLLNRTNPICVDSDGGCMLSGKIWETGGWIKSEPPQPGSHYLHPASNQLPWINLGLTTFSASCLCVLHCGS